MRRFYEWIVGNPKKILAVFVLSAVLCFFLKGMVVVNYDIKDYLPEGTSSTASMNLLQEEFDGGIPNARVLIRNVSVAQALDYKEQLKSCVGVNDVLWLDDAANVLQPIETLDQDTVESYYKDNTALFTVTIEQGKHIEAVDAIRAVIGEENAMSGDAVSTAVATTSTVKEVNIITIFAILFVAVVLVLTTSSWIEPLIVLIGLGIAIVLNGGSNLIFGEISFVTNAAGSILQLAVSLDYSVFLIHRFEECLKLNPDPKQAMVEALCKSTSSIFSSGLTTVIGFFALIFMRFGIGSDLGLALAKGVSISLITVFVFMPVLILAMHRLMKKTHHRNFLPSFHGFGKVVSRLMIPMACIFAVILVPSYLASNANSYYYGASYIFGENTKLGSDTAAIEQEFGKMDTYVVLVPRGDTATEKNLSDALQEIPQVKSVLSYVDTVGAEIPMEYLPEDTLSKLVSDQYSRMVLTIEADHEGEETFALVGQLRETINRYYPDQYGLAGEGVSTFDLMDTITDDMLKVNLIAIGAVFVVLLFTMKSITLPVILVLSIETAIWMNLAIPYFEGSVIFYISYLIISSIQLGATVDYAILLTDRYMEFRQRMVKKQAVIEAVSSSTVSVLTSGTVMAVIGFLLGAVSSHGILSQLGTFLGKGTLLSLVIVLFVLPGLLYLMDGLIAHTTKNANFYKPKEKISHETD